MFKKILFAIFVAIIFGYIALLAACSDSHPSDPKFNVQDTTVIH